MILSVEYGSGGFREIVWARRINGDDDDANCFTLINSNHTFSLPLHFILLFPYEKPGWYWGRTRDNHQVNQLNKNIAQGTSYLFHLHTRPNQLFTLFHVQKLFATLL